MAEGKTLFGQAIKDKFERSIINDTNNNTEGKNKQKTHVPSSMLSFL